MKTIAIDATVVREPLSGVHYVVRAQALSLIERFAAAEPVVLATDPVIIQAARRHDCRCPQLPWRLRDPFWRVLWQQTSLPRLLHRLNVGRLLALAYTAPLRCPVPYCLQVHDTIALDHPHFCRRRNRWHMRALLPPSMRGAETILASTQAVISRVTAYVKKEKRPPLHTVAFGVDEIFLQDPPAAFDAVELPVDAEPYVLFVGTLEPKKGLHSLLTAYASLRGQVNLVLAGQTGWDCGSVLQAIHDYDGPGRIIRLGYVPRSDLPRLYARAAVTVMPSLVEGFGLPVLESMAMNTPVVYSNCEALREVAGDYGFPYVAGEPGPLAECIEDALDEGIADGAQAYARSFTWPRWAEKVNERLDLFPDHG